MDIKEAVGFVNAILRKVSKEDYEQLFQIEDKIEKISKTQSMPKWLIEKLLENNNIEKVEEICKNLNLKPEISIRVNKLRTTKEELLKKLENNGIEVKKADLDDFLILPKAKKIEDMQEFKDGLFTVQDESAGLSALTLNPKDGEIILDACSAPGGKTTYLAELMNNSGQIDAWDIYEHRINLINENCKRLGIKNVYPSIQNAETPNLNQDKKYDKILLDVPCMGIGVIKRKPDIKWQRGPKDIENISKTQINILESCSKLLKEGGELVYSTCSILKEENEDVIEKFLQKNSKFKILTKENIIPTDEYDGFFICKLKNIGENI